MTLVKIGRRLPEQMRNPQGTGYMRPGGFRLCTARINLKRDMDFISFRDMMINQ